MKDIYRYGSEVNSHDLIKILAISTMVIDHIGRFFLANNVWFRVVGRMAAPQFFFLVGYSGSARFKSPILFYGIALSVVYYLTNTSGVSLFYQIFPLNILISFTLIKALLNKFDPIKLPSEYLILLLSILTLVTIPSYFVIEFGTIGLCYAMGARLIRERHRRRHLWIFITVGVHFGMELLLLISNHPEVSTPLLPFVIGLLAIVFVTNLTIFLKYKFHIFGVKNKYIRTLAIYISRYSLEIYFFHLSAFMITYYI